MVPRMVAWDIRNSPKFEVRERTIDKRNTAWLSYARFHVAVCHYIVGFPWRPLPLLYCIIANECVCSEIVYSMIYVLRCLMYIDTCVSVSMCLSDCFCLLGVCVFLCVCVCVCVCVCACVCVCVCVSVCGCWWVIICFTDLYWMETGKNCICCYVLVKNSYVNYVNKILRNVCSLVVFFIPYLRFFRFPPCLILPN